MSVYRVIVAAIVLSLTAHLVLAQSWDGGGANDNWTTVANWNPNGAPVNNGTADLLFAGPIRLTPKVNVNYDVHNVTFAGFDAYNLGQLNNSTLTVRGGIFAFQDATISVPVQFAANGFIHAENAVLNINSSVALGTNTVTINPSLLQETAVINMNAITGTGTIIKDFSGDLNIDPSGTQQYDLMVNAGTITYTNDATFNANSQIMVNGGTLVASDDLVLNGAQLTVTATGAFNLVSNRMMTVQAGADATFLSMFLTGINERYLVTGAGSTFTFTDLDLSDGASINVLAGASLEVTDHFNIGQNGGLSSLVVDGTGSLFKLSNPSVLQPRIAGVQDFDGIMTFRNGATGDLGNDILLVSPGVLGEGTLIVESGAHVNVGSVKVANSIVSGTGITTISGPDSKLTATANNIAFEIGAADFSTGIVNVKSGGELEVNSALTINETGTLNINGGTVSLKLDKALTNKGILTFTTGRLNLGEDFNVGTIPSLLGINVTLQTGRALSVPSVHTTTLSAPGVLVIDGGLLSTGALVNSGGTFDFRRGTLELTGTAGLNVSIAGPLGSHVTVGPGMTLAVPSGDTTVGEGSQLTVAGGTFSTGSVVNAGTALFNGGSVAVGTINNQNTGGLIVGENVAVNIDGQIRNAGTILMGGGLARLDGGGPLVNTGLITGEGRVSKQLFNEPAGEVRAESGKRLHFTVTNGMNEGRITMQGGTLQFSQPLANADSSTISGHGTLFFDGGLIHQGRMQFSGGSTDIYGNVSFTGGVGGGELINSGGDNIVAFYGDVNHNGDEIRTSPTNTTVFFGKVNGAGPFTGTGAVRFEGAFSPGNSPARVAIEGDMLQGASSQLVIELAGTTPGGQYDQIQVDGLLSLCGTLDVELRDGFEPHYGDRFDMFDFGTLAGRFDEINLPALEAGLTWDTSALYSNGSITAVPEPNGWLLALLAWTVVALRESVKTNRTRKCFRLRSRSFDVKFWRTSNMAGTRYRTSSWWSL